jgi:ferredoxin
MRAIRENLLAHAGALERYHEESFQPEAPVLAVPSAAMAADAGGDMAEIRFARSGRTARCGAGTTILEAARSVGIAIPYACSMGLCGTCRVMKTGGGPVRVDHMGGITDSELEQGYVLACCTRPLQRVVEIDA